MKKIIIIVAMFIVTGCDDSVSSNDNSENTSWTFVANEGAFGSSNGSVSMIDDFGNVYETEALGDVVQSLEVYNDKLIVLVNNSHKIKIFDITPEGLSMPGIEVDTEGSSPRELLVLNDKVYFTNWNTQDVKVFNLFNYVVESSISVDGLPEDIMFDGTDLWVTITMNSDWSSASSICRIDMNTNSVVETIEVGDGPQNLIQHDGDIYVSRTFYDASWNAFHGSTKVGTENIINNYGSGVVCGGSVLSYNGSVYRSHNGGISPLDENLDINESGRIGNYNQDEVYHVEVFDGNILFGIRDLSNGPGMVKVVDSNGDEISEYTVGINPGDFAFWSQ